MRTETTHPQVFNNAAEPSTTQVATSGISSIKNSTNLPASKSTPNKSPNVSHNVLVEVTGAFNKATSALDFGQLVKDEGLSLFDAVGALEIGDPKMDSGFLETGETFEHEHDVTRALAAEEVIWLMDELLCLEVAWLSGYPLSQTLFTSIYIDRLLWPEPKILDDASFSKTNATKGPHPLLERVLRSYCLGLIKSCDLVHTMVTSQHYYEEEDFTSQLFHRELLHRFSSEEILSVIDDAVLWLASGQITSQARGALQCRLLLRKNVLQLLHLHATTPLAKNILLNTEHDPIRHVKETSEIGIPVQGAFSLKIQRTLASSVPPRPMVRVQLDEAISYFEQLLLDAYRIPQLLEVRNENNLLVPYWLFVSQESQPSAYIRALLQSLLDVDAKLMGLYTINEFITEELRRTVLPNSLILDPANDRVEAPSDPRFQIAQCRTEFISRVSQSFTNLFRTFCLNRCRIRRTLCHAIIEWDHLQSEAEECDGTLQDVVGEKPVAFPAGARLTFSYPLSSWVYHYKLSQMELLIQMGFELSIYAPDELHQMYWYLSQVCSIHLSHLDRISFFVQDSHNKISDPRSGSHKKSTKGHSQSDLVLQNLFHEYSRLKATEALARALHILYLVLHRHGALTSWPRPYASDRLRYELRMRPFLHISVPEPMDFKEFQAATSMRGRHDAELLEQAARASATAKKAWDDIRKDGWKWSRFGNDHTDEHRSPLKAQNMFDAEWARNTKNVLKACIGTSVTISGLKTRLGDTIPVSQIKAVIPRPGDRNYWHGWWLVPTLAG